MGPKKVTKERPLFARAQARECVAIAWSFRLAIHGSTETTAHPCPAPYGSRSMTGNRGGRKTKTRARTGARQWQGKARQGKARQGKTRQRQRQRHRHRQRQRQRDAMRISARARGTDRRRRRAGGADGSTAAGSAALRGGVTSLGGIAGGLPACRCGALQSAACRAMHRCGRARRPAGRTSPSAPR